RHPKADLSCRRHAASIDFKAPQHPNKASCGDNVMQPAGFRVPEMLNKVPEVTLVFWIIKIMSTTVGETGADYLAVHVGLGTAVTGAIMVALLMAAFTRSEGQTSELQ